MDDKSGSESESDASTSASDEEADEEDSIPRKRHASAKTKAAALDILQGVASLLSVLLCSMLLVWCAFFAAVLHAG